MRKFTHIYARKLKHMHTIIQMGKARVIIIMYVIIQEALLHYCLVFHTSNNLCMRSLTRPPLIQICSSVLVFSNFDLPPRLNLLKL